MTATGVSAYDFSQPPPGFSAGAINTLQLYLSDQVTYDDNLFRVPPGTVGVPGAVFANAHQSDVANSATIGGQGKWAIGRQEIDLDVRADENRFKDNANLDFVSANAVAAWNWRVGEYFSGQVESIYDRSLASFSETRYNGKDVVTSLEQLGSARYQVGPHWAAYGQIRGSYLEHSATAVQHDNFHNKAGIAGVQYATNVNDTVGFEYQRVNIKFNNGVVGGQQAFDYNEDTGKFLVKYALTDKTSIDAYAGYLRRSYLGVSVSSFSGAIWRATFALQATDKTSLSVAAYHELHAYLDAESNYFVAKGVAVTPAWTATEKLSFSLAAFYENEDYIASNSGLIALGGGRTAKVNAQQATIRYTPRDAWIVDVFFRHQKRQSNQANFANIDNLASVSLTFRFW